jgi:hypothetical protein
MKKLLLLLAISFIGTSGFAQSERMVLFEEFTSENCPPCATYNPAFNDLLNANPTTVVAIKYQNDIPSAGPMYYHNTVDVEARQTYYSNSSSPNAKGDGSAMTIPSSGHPAYVTQALINGRLAIQAPFTVDVTHYLSSDNDSIYCQATITCTQATSGTFVAQMAVIERNVYFVTAPGSNGEKHFEGVMKKMLPSATGTAMTGTQTVGLVTNLNYAWALSNVYNLNQLAVVVFVQNNANKNVMQSGYSRTLINNDAGTTDVTGIPTITCTGQVTPVATIYNYGIATLTTCSLTTQIDAGPITYTPWAGSLPSYGQTTVTLPTITVPSGSHTLTIGTTSPNASTDLDVNNDRIITPVNVMGTPVVTPLIQQFTTATFPPAGWIKEDVQLDNYTWARVTAGLPSYSAKCIFYYSPNTYVDNMYTPLVNFTNAVSGAALDFDVSYAQYAAENDRLKISVSTDCGNTWDTPIYNLAGAALATHAPVGTGQYTPATSADWRHESVSLAAYAGQPDILIQFSGISNYGNNLYIDNINVTDGVTGVNLLTNAVNGVTIYPNPSKGELNVNYNFNQTQNLTITVSNVLGSTVKTFELNSVSSGILPIDMTNAAKGSYFVTIRSNDGVVTKKITIAD